MLTVVLNAVEIVLLLAIVYGQHRNKAAWDVLTKGAQKVADATVAKVTSAVK